MNTRLTEFVLCLVAGLALERVENLVFGAVVRLIVARVPSPA